MKKEISFPKSPVKFLSALKRNNNREWFEKNRDRYDIELLQPAVRFVVDMGERLSGLSPNIFAVPKIDKSIFRLHRDVRFSKNKAPYKTNLGLYFWEGKGKKMECSGLYFHIEPSLFFLGAGMYQFSKDQIKKYRTIVSEPLKGKELNDLLNKLLKNKKYNIGGKTYKKTPRGFDPEYKYSNLLLHSGLYIYLESKNLKELSDRDPVTYTFKIFKDLYPLHRWLAKNIN